MMKRLLGWLVVVLILISGGWFAWWCLGRTPVEEVRDAQEKLIRKLEKRDWSALEAMIAEDYSDDNNLDHAGVVETAKKVLGGFYTLTVHTETVKLNAVPPSGVGTAIGMIQMKIRLEGNGAGFSQVVLQRANQVTEPWFFHWQKKGRWPWDWKVVQIHNNQIP